MMPPSMALLPVENIFVSGELELGSLMSLVWQKAGEARATIKTKEAAPIIEICKHKKHRKNC
jgi:hypothetical protein